MTSHTAGPYDLHLAGPQHLDGARSVMLDTFYHVFGLGYRPEWHADVIDLHGTYLRCDHQALFVATKGDEVVATTAVRAAAPNSPPHPRWLADRYPAATTAQLFRVYVRPEHRRNGLARTLVHHAVQFVAGQPRYQSIYLHTNTRIDGAAAFWHSVATPVHHSGDTAHFEIAIPARAAAAQTTPARQLSRDRRRRGSHPDPARS
jgi:GNAT superfamily N-acetyltransferase